MELGSRKTKEKEAKRNLANICLIIILYFILKRSSFLAVVRTVIAKRQELSAKGLATCPSLLAPEFSLNRDKAYEYFKCTQPHHLMLHFSNLESPDCIKLKSKSLASLTAKINVSIERGNASCNVKERRAGFPMLLSEPAEAE